VRTQWRRDERRRDIDDQEDDEKVRLKERHDRPKKRTSNKAKSGRERGQEEESQNED